MWLGNLTTYPTGKIYQKNGTTDPKSKKHNNMTKSKKSNNIVLILWFISFVDMYICLKSNNTRFLFKNCNFNIIVQILLLIEMVTVEKKIIIL